MSFDHRPLTAMTAPRSLLRRCGRSAAVALALSLAGCANDPAPPSQPLDLGKPAGQQGADQHLAQSGDHERMMPQGSMAAQPGGDMLTNGVRVPAQGAVVASPQQMGQQAQAFEDPTQPTSVEPGLDTSGFDPSPQGAGEIDHGGASGDIAAPPGPQR